MKVITSSFIFIFLFFVADSIAQTCCSGGVPVSGNLGLPSADARTLQFNWSYDYNNLSTLKTGRDILDDNSRKRTTHSFLLEVGYNLTQRISIDAFFSFVRQERLINQIDLTATQGLGDMVFLLKYQLFQAKTSNSNLVIGGGVKLPTGSSNLRNSNNGLPLNADLQPGSGAFDLIGWMQWSRPANFRPSLQYSSTLIFSHKGGNDNYLGNSRYQFGQEWSWATGVSDQFSLGKYLINPALQLRYRHANPDLFDRGELPSTGGDWIFIIPGFSIWWTPKFSLESNVELPLFARIEGTQVTPTFRFNIGFFYKINFSKDKITPTYLIN